MNKNKTNLLITFIVYYLFLISCNKHTGSGVCEEAFTIENSSGIELHIKDTTLNRFVYNTFHPIYNIDSLQIFNSQGLRYNFYKFKSIDSSNSTNAYYLYNAIGIFSLYDERYDSNMYNDTIQKDIYIRYSSNKFDTLSLSYKANAGYCGSEFTFIKVMQHNKVISYTQNNFIPDILIKK